MRIAAAVLAGGQSRRMGRDKANLPSLENAHTTMLLRTVNLAAVVFDPVYVVGRSQPEEWPARQPDTLFLPDEAPDLGPAGGLATVLKALTSGVGPEQTAVAALACDLPLLTTSSLAWLCGMASKRMGRHGLAVRNGDQLEPLFAVYTGDCLLLLEDHLAKGRRSLQKLIEAGEFAVADAPLEVAQTLVNVNTAEELAQVRSLVDSRRDDESSHRPLFKNP